jgi:hypothetical protein
VRDAKGALQLALPPPLLPSQAHVHGPVPLTVVTVPAVQRLVVGAVVTATPFAEPQTPLTATDCSGALHEELVPPLLPSHIQAQGPDPVTVVAAPAVQRLVVGAVVTATPFAEPQSPLTATDCSGALHEELVPPLLPSHIQAQGPDPVTVVAAPAVQRLVVGAIVTATPFAEPQTPLMATDCSGALHEEFVPPLLPSHIQAQGPDPVTVVAAPAVQRLVVGAVVTATPFAGPQTPLTAVEASGAEQDAVVPPFLPTQLQSHGPVPVSADATPELQSPLVGSILVATPFAGPHTPFT